MPNTSMFSPLYPEFPSLPHFQFLLPTQTLWILCQMHSLSVLYPPVRASVHHQSFLKLIASIGKKILAPPFLTRWQEFQMIWTRYKDDLSGYISPLSEKKKVKMMRNLSWYTIQYFQHTKVKAFYFQSVTVVTNLSI